MSRHRGLRRRSERRTSRRSIVGGLAALGALGVGFLFSPTGEAVLGPGDRGSGASSSRQGEQTLLNDADRQGVVRSVSPGDLAFPSGSASAATVSAAPQGSTPVSTTAEGPATPKDIPDAPSAPSAARNVTRTPTPSSAPSIRVRIDEISEPRPRCAAFTGEGVIPTGSRLWLAVLSNEPKYYLNPVSFNSNGRTWTATKVTLGAQDEPEGQPYGILAVVADPSGDQAIRKADLVNGLTSLPPGTRVTSRITVTRGPNAQACVWN